MPQSVDLFCKVIDNFGDIGVCWRLAHQLRHEFNLTVRLWVDDLESFRYLCPELLPDLLQQDCRGVDVRKWCEPVPALEPHDLVIEAFACDPPETFVAAMVSREPRPIWINLEYLSAENWVEGCHCLASPHPRLPLTKYFFFPGFTAATGGLLCENALQAQCRQFQSNPTLQAEYWQSLQLPPPQAGELRVSLFAYENTAVASLLDAMAASDRAVTCLLPLSRVATNVFAWLGIESAVPFQHFQRGALSVVVLPFVEQPLYDRLLWACDVNFVRGEDSLVRAQWAARPLVWHIYPQDDAAHLIKLDALLARYCLGLDTDAAEALRLLWHGWNHQQNVSQAWNLFCQHHKTLTHHATQWAGQLATLGDLAGNMLQFCKKIS